MGAANENPDTAGPAAVEHGEMGEVLAALQFDHSVVYTPWDATGHVNLSYPGDNQSDAGERLWQLQTMPLSAAVGAALTIIEALAAETVDETQLIYRAVVNGWVADGRLSALDFTGLLRLYGVTCRVNIDAGVRDLMVELARGRMLVVFPHTGRVWDADEPLGRFFEQVIDRVIWAGGVQSQGEASLAVVDVSGTEKTYPLTLFAEHWGDSGFFYYVATVAPHPGLAGTAVGFDARTGMFSGIADYFGERYKLLDARLNGARGNAATLVDNPLLALGEEGKNQLIKSI